MADSFKEESGLRICTLWIYPGQASKTRFDVVIVEGGHNGLTRACDLAKAGHPVGVFEPRSPKNSTPVFAIPPRSTRSARRTTVIRDLRLGAQLLGAALSQTVRRILRVGSATFRMNVARSELQKFTATPRFRIRGCAPAGMSRNPIVETLIPSTPDSSLALKGAHIASMWCQLFAYKLPGDRDWRQEKTRAEDLHFATVESYAPNFRASIVGQSSFESARSRRKTRPSR